MAANYCIQSNKYSTETLFASVISSGVGFIKKVLLQGVDIDSRDSEGNTPLLLACCYGRERNVDLLIKSGANVACCDKRGFTVLHFASILGWTEIVESLVEKMPDLDVRDNRGETAMHLASGSGHLSVVQCLLDKDADMDLKNIKGFTPLLCAAKYSRKDIVDLLLDYRANVDGKEWLLLYYASRNNWTELVKSLVNRIPDLNIRHVLAGTVLDATSSRGQLKVLKCLVERERTDANTANEMIVQAALFDVKLFGHLKVLKWLVKRAPDINEGDYLGRTALHHASNQRNLALVKYLVEKGADINARDEFGGTALFIASKNGHLEIVKYLVEVGVDINTRDEKGQAVLHEASRKGHIEVVKYLVKIGADINLKSFDGETPLLHAAQGDHKDVVDLLMYLGADVGGLNRSRLTMLHFAAKRGWTDIVQFLVKRGCELDARDLFGFTALSCACAEKNWDAVQCLLKAGACCSIANMNDNSPLNYLTYVPQRPRFKFIKLLIENGAYLKPIDYRGILKSSSLKVLKNLKISCQSIVNKFNNHSLPELYKLLASESLPRMEEFKIASDSEAAQALEQTVEFEIQTKGHCNILEVRPMVLSMMCVRSVLEYCEKKKSKLQSCLKRPATFDSSNECQHSSKVRRLS